MTEETFVTKQSPNAPTFEADSDMIEAVPGHKKRPASVLDGAEDGANPITFREVGLMPTIVPIASDIDEESTAEIARQYLRLCAVQMEQAVRNRNLYTKLARAHGLTNQSIADELGVTEGRVRQIVSEE